MAPSKLLSRFVGTLFFANFAFFAANPFYAAVHSAPTTLMARRLGFKDEAYRSFAQLFPRVPYVTDDAIRAALEVTDHPKAAAANPKEFYHNCFLQELESSGLVREIYAGK